MNNNLMRPTRNSLIELYRFLFAMWVVYYHGYFFIPKTQLFSGGYIAVEFFFTLTGFFLLPAIIKSSDKSYFQGGLNLSWKKLKPLGVTFLISVVFSLIYFFRHFTKEPCDPLGFMWYIEWLIIVPLIYYTLYYLIKNKKIFNIVTICIVIVSHVIESFVLVDWGMFRGMTSIGLGMLVSQIPKNSWKIGKININLIISVVLIIGTIIAGCNKAYIPYADHIFILLLFPALLYFASCVNIDCGFLNYLGGLSFGLYAYQTVNRVLEDFNILNDKIHNAELFCILLFLAVFDDLIKRVIKAYKNDRMTKLNKI